jgi:hypothetical protein
MRRRTCITYYSVLLEAAGPGPMAVGLTIGTAFLLPYPVGAFAQTRACCMDR